MAFVFLLLVVRLDARLAGGGELRSLPFDVSFMTFFIGVGTSPGDGARLLPELVLCLVVRNEPGGVSAGVSGTYCGFPGVLMGDFRITSLTGLALRGVRGLSIVPVSKSDCPCDSAEPDVAAAWSCASHERSPSGVPSLPL